MIAALVFFDWSFALFLRRRTNNTIKSQKFKVKERDLDGYMLRKTDIPYLWAWPRIGSHPKTLSDIIILGIPFRRVLVFPKLFYLFVHLSFPFIE
jgi:hypothetical protein